MSVGLVTRLLESGYAPGDAERWAAALARVTDALERSTGQRPPWQWCVPGRIEIFGKHTDYAGGRSLLAAVPRGFAVAASPRQDGRVRVVDVRHGDSVVVDPGAAGQPVRGWANYVAVTVRRLARDFPGAAVGTDIAMTSDLPRAAGLSSSSALVVAIALAVIRRAGLQGREDWQDVIRSVEDLAWYLGCVENGLTYKSLPGAQGVGTHGGSQDHTAILACRPGLVSHYSFMPVVAHGTAAMPPEWRFVAATSGVHADKAGSVRDRYNRASLAVRALLDLWNAQAGMPAASLAAALESGPGAEAHLREIASRRPVEGFSAGDLDRRLTQFARETVRIPQAALAFAAADMAGLTALTSSSQADAEQLLGNQIPETVALVRLAHDEGAFAASAFGAGFGGSVWALVAGGDAEAAAFGEAWTARFRERFPMREAASWFSAVPGPGALEVGSSS